MTIFQLQERLHNTAYSGAGLISEDFRLHKAIEEFSVLAPKNPVFTKIYQTVKPLSDPSSGDKTTILLDAITLVDAVCMTMAQTASPESPETVRAEEYTDPGQKRYSEIADIVEALSSKGSGRLSVVENKKSADINVFKDYRIEPLLWKGIDDNIHELGVLCGDILIEIHGEEALNKIISQINITNTKKTPALRRIDILSGKRPALNYLKELVMNEDALIDIRRGAVFALRLDESEFSFYEEIYNREKKLKEAVYSATIRMECPAAKELHTKYYEEMKALRENNK